MRLYNYWRSTSSWRVRIALAYKNLPYEDVPVHLVRYGGEQYKAAFERLNPRHEVPVLEVTEDGATVHLGQSMAILEYLEECYPNPPLLPGSARERAKVRQLAEIVNSGIQPLQNLAVLKQVSGSLGGDDKAWARQWITRGLQALEVEGATHAGTYLVGDAVSFADLFLIPQLYAARRFGVDLQAFPTLLRVEHSCSGLAAFASAHADLQTDAVAAS
jgi:maleylpyruvate isomerase